MFERMIDTITQNIIRSDNVVIGNNNSMNGCTMISGRGKTVVNGVEYDIPDGASVSIINGNVYVNDRLISPDDNKDVVRVVVKLKIEGKADVNISGNATIEGDIYGNVETRGNATIGGSVKGSVDCRGNAIVSGSVEGNVACRGNYIGR